MIFKKDVKKRIGHKLRFLYGAEQASHVLREIEKLLKNYRGGKKYKELNEKDALLVIYPDQIKEKGKKPLVTLREFAQKHFDCFSVMHILSFFPYSSDRGFSIIDYEKVRKALGSWEDIEQIEKKHDLMFDLALNHVSSRHKWFKGFLNGNRKYMNYFHYFDNEEDIPKKELAKVFRPRSNKIFTKFKTKQGNKWVWTTFSEDQVDLNYKNPEVLVEMIKVLFLYVSRGARAIRLDAIAFLWDKLGTRSAHLPQTHTIVQIMREILDCLNKNLILVTETNVAHKDNISYFSNKDKESKIVYNFALPGLVLDAFYREDVERLLQWASKLEFPGHDSNYFNFLDTHDGIGLLGVRGILTKKEIRDLKESAVEKGALINYRSSDEKNVPYELASTWFHVICGCSETTERSLRIKAYIASRAISLSLRGIPLIYFHGLLGTMNDYDVVKKSGHQRDVNRQNLRRKELEQDLEDERSKKYKVFNETSKLLRARSKEKAFHPKAKQKCLFVNKRIFSLLRESLDGKSRVLCLVNVSGKEQEINVPGNFNLDIITGQKLYKSKILFEPYEVLWLK